MNNQSDSLPAHLVESPEAIPWYLRTDGEAISPLLLKYWIATHEKMKKDLDLMSAEVVQRQEKMKFINEIIAELNCLIDDKNGIDLKTHSGLKEKLTIAAEKLGVKIDLKKDTYNPLEFSRLIQNLTLHADGLDKDNKMTLQKIDVQNRLSDRLMMMMNTIQKSENQAISRVVQGIKS